MTERRQSPERQQLEVPAWSKLMEEALTMPGQLSTIYNRFYNYSFGNQVLLYMQGVREPVNTYQRWADMGRQVQRGSKAKAILRPVTIKLKDELDAEGNPKQITKFKLVNCLFTASETEGEPLPEFKAPDWNPHQAMLELDIEEVPFQEVNGNIQGFSIERKVAINPVAAYPVKTLIHEMAHVLLGHTQPSEHDNYRTHRGVAEFQAEATAYLVMNDLGALEHMDAAGSRDYIQVWLLGERPADAAIREVFKAVDTILKAGRGTVENSADNAA